MEKQNYRNVDTACDIERVIKEATMYYSKQVIFKEEDNFYYNRVEGVTMTMNEQ